jgi:hypothetical protein
MAMTRLLLPLLLAWLIPASASATHQEERPELARFFTAEHVVGTFFVDHRSLLQSIAQSSVSDGSGGGTGSKGKQQQRKRKKADPQSGSGERLFVGE